MAESTAATIERLRRRMAEIPARSADPAGPSLAALTQPSPEHSEVEPDTRRRAEPSPIRTVPVPPPIADLLPHRGLVRGSTIRVDGVAALRAGLIASVTGAGGWAAVVGSPNLSLLAAAEMGADLSRCAVIEDAGPDAVAVAAVLVEGIDLVLVSLAGADVPPSRARAVTARARRHGAVLAFTEGRWPTTDVHLDARVVGYHGLEPGYGRITGIDLDVEVTARGGRPRRRTVTLNGGGGRVDWTVAADDSTAAAPLRMAR